MPILTPVFPAVVRLLDDALTPGAASAFPCRFRRGSLTDTAVEVVVFFDQRCPFASGQGVTGDRPVPEQTVRLWGRASDSGTIKIAENRPEPAFRLPQSDGHPLRASLQAAQVGRSPPRIGRSPPRIGGSLSS